MGRGPSGCVCACEYMCVHVCVVCCMLFTLEIIPQGNMGLFQLGIIMAIIRSIKRHSWKGRILLHQRVYLTNSQSEKVVTI